MRSLVWALPVLAFTSVTMAQEATAPAAAPAAVAEGKKLGWTPTAKLGANAAVSSASNVVGQTDGTSQTYGLGLSGSYDNVAESSEWKNTLSYTGATTRTPSQPRFVKSGDLLKFESLYLYTFSEMPRVGPYVKASAEAPAFFGEDVRPTAVTYNIVRNDGSTQSFASDSLRLTDGFRPLTTKESVGANYKAVREPNASVDARLGLGAEQIAANGQLTVTGTDAATGAVNVVELRDLSQVGLEAALTGKGKFNDNAGWEASIETLTPFVNNKQANDDRDALRLTNIDGNAKISSNLTTWAALTYNYKVQIKPQLVDRTQQTHLMVLNINYNLL